MEGVKYEIDEEKYKARPDSFHQYKQRHLKGFYKEKAEKALKAQEASKAAAEKMEVGMRCETGTKKNPRRGEVKWKGTIGVGEFQCPDKYGLFVQAHKMQVGDFPEIDEFVS